MVNPKAGMRHAGAGDLDAALATLRGAGMELETAETSLEGPTAEDVARRAVAEQRDALVVAGGDGTVQPAAKALIGTNVVLGILPFGTHMNVTRGLGIPLEPLPAAEVIARGHVRRADVGEVRGAVFVEGAGVGLDAHAFGAARAAERGRWRRAWRRVIGWATQGSHRIRVRGERGQIEYRAMQVLVLNSPYYGWSLPMVGGDMHDGLLEVAIFPRMGRVALARDLVRLWREGQHEAPPIVVREREVTISADGPVAIHADGTMVGTTPATFRCRHDAFAVYVPGPATT